MIIKNKDIFDYLCGIAPLELQEDYDNAGFVLGDPDVEVHKVLLALDATETVLDEALYYGVQLIITHHPLIWKPIRKLRTDFAVNQILVTAIKNDISVISMHTNLDKCSRGVNDVLIRMFDVTDVAPLNSENCGCLGYRKKEMSMQDFLPVCKALLHASGLKYYDSGRTVRKIAVVGGSGGSFISDAYEQECDTLITADVKYDQFLLAQTLKINLIDADHFSTENPVIHRLNQMLQMEFPEVQFIESAIGETAHIFK